VRVFQVFQAWQRWRGSLTGFSRTRKLINLGEGFFKQDRPSVEGLCSRLPPPVRVHEDSDGPDALRATWERIARVRNPDTLTRAINLGEDLLNSSPLMRAPAAGATRKLINLGEGFTVPSVAEAIPAPMPKKSAAPAESLVTA
jgi:hypothetical protein